MRYSRLINGYQVEADGSRVWVNAPTGENIGRFSRTGVDVHKTLAEQQAGSECLNCTHRMPATVEDWESFKRSLLEHYKVAVPERYRPSYLKREG